MPNYIDKEEFIKLILVYRKTKNRILYNEIGKRFLAIVINTLRLPCFINYTEDRKSEMISDALFYMVKNIDDYDPMFFSNDILKGNPFQYFSVVAKRAFFQKIAEYKKRDVMFKPISYIDNIEGKTFNKSTIFKDRVEETNSLKNMIWCSTCGRPTEVNEHNTEELVRILKNADWHIDVKENKYICPLCCKKQKVTHV